MIIVKIIGGLGNQMFQYALLRSLQKDGFTVKADLSEFGKEGLTLHNGYELNRIFDILLDEADNHEINSVKNNKSLPYYFRRLGNKIFRVPLPHYREGTFPAERLKEKRDFWNRKNAYLDGYWQSAQFFQNDLEDIYKAYKFPPFNKPENKDLSRDVKSNNSVSIHIRGGDYISTPELYNLYGCVCDKDYYNKAIDYIRSKVANPHFYVFTNDQDWYRENITIDDSERTLIDWNKGEDSFRDMQLMSLCRHQILANSSFSWWASYLNRNEGITISPSKWTSKDNQKDIFLARWHRI